MHATEILQRIDRLCTGVDDREPRSITLLSPEEVAVAKGEGMRVFRVLARVSDDKLLSIPQQVRECARYALGEAVGGVGRPTTGSPVVVDRVYNLGEQSGFSIHESPIMQLLLREAAEGDWDGLVVRDSSRLGRDYWEKMGTIRDLRARRVELHVIEDGGFFDYEDSLNKVRSFANTWADEGKKLEEIRKSMRATDALRDAGFPTTSVPFGYAPATDPRMRRRVWRPTEEAEVVRRIFAELAEEPHQEQAFLARKYGVSKQLLRKILRNRAYTGGFNWKGEFIEADPSVVPPIVPAAVFDAVQEHLDRRRRNGGRSRPGGFRNPEMADSYAVKSNS